MDKNQAFVYRVVKKIFIDNGGFDYDVRHGLPRLLEEFKQTDLSEKEYNVRHLEAVSNLSYREFITDEKYKYGIDEDDWANLLKELKARYKNPEAAKKEAEAVHRRCLAEWKRFNKLYAETKEYQANKAKEERKKKIDLSIWKIREAVRQEEQKDDFARKVRQYLAKAKANNWVFED